MAKILITGGSGLLGKAISGILLDKNHEVAWLSRDGGQYGSIKKYRWDIKTKFIDPAAFSGTGHIIHLAGAGIMDARWSRKYKKEIINSRVKSAELLFNTMVKTGTSLKSFIGTSAVGFYSTELPEVKAMETDVSGNDFLARVCVAWEEAYGAFQQKNIRTLIFRTGVILSADGGAFPKLKAPLKLGVAPIFGDGRQYFPWIHISDAAQAYVYALFETGISGTFNLAASETPTNREFAEALAKKSGRKVLFPQVPYWLLRMAMGERASTLTTGKNISNRKLMRSGFTLNYPYLANALDELT